MHSIEELPTSEFKERMRKGLIFDPERDLYVEFTSGVNALEELNLPGFNDSGRFVYLPNWGTLKKLRDAEYKEYSYLAGFHPDPRASLLRDKIKDMHVVEGDELKEVHLAWWRANVGYWFDIGRTNIHIITIIPRWDNDEYDDYVWAIRDSLCGGLDNRDEWTKTPPYSLEEVLAMNPKEEFPHNKRTKPCVDCYTRAAHMMRRRNEVSHGSNEA